MEDVKKALMCAAVDGGLSVLIKGPAGTAKSVLVRSFVDLLPDKKIINVPQNVTDEQLFGGLDIENAILSGKTIVKEGILQNADRNILYLDNVNLFEPKILGNLMGCVGSGKVKVEREGVSAEYELDTTVIATMDPAEQEISDGTADRFDICVQSYPIADATEREALIFSNLEFDSDPKGFAERYSAADENVVRRIQNARNILDNVTIAGPDLKKISRVCLGLGVKGHRADISMARVSKALAALDERIEVSGEDIRNAGVMCLLHRRHDTEKERRSMLPKDVPDEDESEDTVITPAPKPIDNKAAPANASEGYGTVPSDKPAVRTEGLGTVAEIIGSVKEELKDMDEIEAIRLGRIAGKTVRRERRTEKERKGRYRGSSIPEGRVTDVAFDATVRAAAPYQRSRSDKGLSISIEKQDVREKIRERKDPCSFLFAVDLSGSLVKCGMMEEIKDGIKGMLMDNYVRRDKVALLTFRTYDVKISVPFTRSVEGICDTLENTETGGGTPLGAALLLIREYLLSYLRKNADERCFVILMTDGEATDPVIEGEPWAELKKITATMNIPRTEWMVVDSGLFAGRVNFALRLSKLLGAGYIKLGDLGSV